MRSDRPPHRRSDRGRVEFHSRIAGARVRRAFASACARCGTRWIAGNVGQINLILVNDRDMARLHRTYSGVRGTTDVLTFDLTEPTLERVEGDIFICLDQARRQAAACRVPLYLEIGRLAAHGVLHLAGFRDGAVAQRAQMRRLEDTVLQAAMVRP